MPERRLIWDMPTRVFHWSLALSFLGAYLSGESERWALVHLTCGYTFLGLIIFRLIWGVAGTRYARFTEFVPSPSSVLKYLAGLVKRRPTHYIGHNPLGALGILAILLLGLICAVSGWLINAEVGPFWLEPVHLISADILVGLVLAHIAGVLITSYLHRENLIKAMLDGKKQAEAAQAIPQKRPLIAFLLLICMVAFWLWSFSATLFSSTVETSVVISDEKTK
jgi:cytochrome b